MKIKKAEYIFGIVYFVMLVLLFIFFLLETFLNIFKGDWIFIFYGIFSILFMIKILSILRHET